MTIISKKLSELEIGEEATIDSLSTSHVELRIKLQTFGLLKGTRVVVKSIAPLGDPITVLVRGFTLSLRKSEADALTVSYFISDNFINESTPLVANPQIS